MLMLIRVGGGVDEGMWSVDQRMADRRRGALALGVGYQYMY
jgi:hypothetical protein